jgi:hypothetical protein
VLITVSKCSRRECEVISVNLAFPNSYDDASESLRRMSVLPFSICLLPSSVQPATGDKVDFVPCLILNYMLDYGLCKQ